MEQVDRIVQADHVSMQFHMDVNRTTSLKEWVVSHLTGKANYQDFCALNDVSITVNRGEVVGIVGRNGSGKSTLLKVISGIYKPTKGKCVTNGRIAPMLELGSGFDYELSGHENVFLNGSILGYSEPFLKSRYDEIVEFAELGQFIHQPIKTYSSGMLTRLAFAIATIVEPELLIVDEILAVGDEQFQKKSGARMKSLMEGGTTVLMVSHNLNQIRQMCTRVVWLQRGVVREDGPAEVVCDHYAAAMVAGEI